VTAGEAPGGDRPVVDGPVMDGPGGEWAAVVGDLRERRTAARAMGGPERLARQHEHGRLDARSRVAALCDPGTFVELGTLAGAAGGSPADALVAGHALIDGRPVVVGAEDFTVKGGSIGPGTHAKRFRLAELAGRERVPIVMLLDGAGERVSNAGEPAGRAPNDLQAMAALAGIVPRVSVIMGPSAGHGALTAVLSDHVVMVEGAAIFSAGPPLVSQATGEVATAVELGGVAVHARASGVVHDVAADDRSALDQAKRWLSYLPGSAWDRPPLTAGADAEARPVPALYDLIPANHRRPYDVRPVIAEVFDAATVLEVAGGHGESMVTALGRLGGRPVGIVANQPEVLGGAIDVAAALKAARFLDVVGAFHLPVVFLADNPGVLPGSASEQAGILRASARMYAAQARLQVPKLHVTFRKAYGFGSSLMAMNPFDDQTTTFAFPGVELAAMPAAGGAAAGAYRSAERLGYDEIIEPAELRDALLGALRLASTRLETGPLGPVAHPGPLP